MRLLSKDDIQFFKGIGIIMIIFHNFFHWLTPITKENEFSYNYENFERFIENITYNPSDFIQYISSYFGHYGVQLFIFCSGYGLAIIYSNKKEIIYIDFIKKRLMKLYPVFTIALGAFLIYNYIIFNVDFTLQSFTDLILRYLLIANLIPGKIFVISGPFWFYSMIFQLYLCFPLIIKLNKKYKYSLWWIILTAYLITICTNNYFVSIQLSLYYNFIANLPVFIFGIILALKQINLSINKTVYCILSILLFFLGQFNEYIWYFSQITFSIFIIEILCYALKKASNTTFSRFIIHIGYMSMYIFAISGFLRSPWVYLVNKSSNMTISTLYVILYLVIVYIGAVVIKKVEFLFLKRIKSKIE